MIRRWRSILHPEQVDRMRPPTAGEAAASLFLGSAWLLYGIWLAVSGLPLWLPTIPVAALVAMWGWKRRGTWYAFPAAAVLAALLDMRLEGNGPTHLLDLVMTGTGLIVVARVIARGLPRRTASVAERVLSVALAVGAGAAMLDPHGIAPRAWRLVPAGTAVFAAAWLAARRPLPGRRARFAFPVAAAVLGAGTLVAWGARGAPVSQAGAVGTLLTLAAALPFAWCMALRDGRSRFLAAASALVGSVALGAELAALLQHAGPWHPLADGRVLAVLGTAVVAGARPDRRSSPEAGRAGRWRVGLTVTLAVLAMCEGDPQLLPVALFLAATAAGLAFGSPRARRARVIPLRRPAWNR